jgi:hypothetical protein
MHAAVKRASQLAYAIVNATLIPSTGSPISWAGWVRVSPAFR